MATEVSENCPTATSTKLGQALTFTGTPAPAAETPGSGVMVGAKAVACGPHVAGAQSTSPPTSITQFPYAPSLISAVLVIAGWIVVNKAQANRERRKQIREFASGLMKDLAELEKSIIEYHTSERDRSAEQAIISKLTRFERACGLLPKFVESQRFLKAARPTYLSVPAAVIQTMRKAMTLNHFSDEHTEPIKTADILIQTIEVATNEVQEQLEHVRLAALD